MKRIITIAFICWIVNLAFSQNFGIDIPNPTRKLEVNGDIKLSPGYQLYFGESVTTSSKIGINFHTDGDPNYGIYKPAGAWTQPLHIGFYTGVKIGANAAYGGTKFYNSSDMGTEIMSVGNGDNHVRIGGYMLSQYVNTTDNIVSSGVTGIMVKAGDNYYRTANAAAIQAFIGSSGADNLGNHTATTTLNMNNQSISNVSDIYAVQNYGRGLVGVYSDVRYQNVWAMGTSWRLAADGTTPGNLYGLAWTHSNIGGQSRAGLSHQLLVMENGSTKVALGSGIWTAYVTQSDQGFNVDGNTVIDDGAGWLRSYGNTGWYNGTHAGGWFMQDATWIRNYNDKLVYINTNGGSISTAMMFDSNGGTQDHVVATENNGWGYLGTSGARWWAIYSSQVLNPSTLKLKTDVKYLSSTERDNVLDAVNNIESIRYKWNKEVWQKENGYFTDGRYHAPGEKPDPNQEVQEWMGFTAESLPEDCLDNTGENFQIGAMLGLLVASTKALSKRTEVLGDALNVDFDNLPKDKMDKNISDFGTGIAKGNEMWVSYSADFAAQLGGNIPVITVTTDNPEVTLSVRDKSSKGFKVVSSSGKTANFDYIAMAKVKYTLPQDSPEQIAKQQKVFKTDLNAWRAEEMKNQKMLPQQIGDPAQEALKLQAKNRAEKLLAAPKK